MAKVIEVLKKNVKFIIPIIAVIIGLIRYAVCKDINCAVSWGITAMLFLWLAWILFNAVIKGINKVREKRAKGGDN